MMLILYQIYKDFTKGIDCGLKSDDLPIWRSFLNAENHWHEIVDGNMKGDRFSSKANVEVDDSTREGIKRNETLGQIRLQLQKVAYIQK